MNYLYFVLLFVFIILVLILTGIVLMQEPKSGGLSAALGGGGGGIESFLGARGAPTFFMKATWVMGGLYMAMSLALSLMSARVQGGTTIEREIQSGDLYKKLAPLSTEQQPGNQNQGGK